MDKAKAAKPKRATIASYIFEKLREGILSGRFAPGERLKTEPLRLTFEAGLSPVREALNRLTAEGLAIQHDQRGFFVSPVHPAELADITAVRCLVGEAALRASMKNGDAAWEERVLLAHHRFDRQLAPPSGGSTDFRERARCHRALHTALLDACKSPWLLSIWDTLFDRAERYQALFIDHTQHARNPRLEHRELTEAALARDVEKAVALHEAHIRRTEEMVAALLRTEGNLTTQQAAE